jgi:hypothetical protein
MTDAVFDLAINRAALLVQRLGWAQLVAWHARTRFAARVPLETIVVVLKTRPEGVWHWVGGQSGGWRAGETVFK